MRGEDSRSKVKAARWPEYMSRISEAMYGFANNQHTPMAMGMGKEPVPPFVGGAGNGAARNPWGRQNVSPYKQLARRNLTISVIYSPYSDFANASRLTNNAVYVIYPPSREFS